jgi:hypothetical protein
MATFQEQLSSTKDESLKRIGEHLLSLASKEPEFLIKLQNEKKSLEKCMIYIQKEIQKLYQVKGKSVVCATDEQVFSLAVHYFDDVDLEQKEDEEFAKQKQELADKKKVITATTLERVPIIKPAAKDKSKPEGQISLFDLLDEEPSTQVNEDSSEYDEEDEEDGDEVPDITSEEDFGFDLFNVKE